MKKRFIFRKGSTTIRRKSANSSENLAAKKRTFRRKGVILLLACCGQKVQFPDAKKRTFRTKGVIWPTAGCGEKVHIHRKLWRRNSAHSEGTVRFCLVLVAAKNVHFGSEKVHIPTETLDLLVACFGEKVHIPKKSFDFACCLRFVYCKMMFWSIFELDEIWRRQSVHSEGKAGFVSFLLR